MKMTNLFMNKKCVGLAPVPSREFDGFKIEKTKNSVYVYANSGDVFWCSARGTWNSLEQMGDWLVNHRDQEAPQWVRDFCMQIVHTRADGTASTWLRCDCRWS